MTAAHPALPADAGPLLRADRREAGELPRENRGAALFFTAAAVALAVGAGAWHWWARQQAPAMPPVQAVQPVAPAVVQPVAPAVAPTEEILPPQPATPLASGDVLSALVALLGRPAVGAFLVTEDFPRRVAATVDNLGRAHAPVAAWPLVPTQERFLTEGEPAQATIAAANAARYRPFVALVESVSPAAAADLYRRIYPLLQQAWRELGMGERPFHGRVIAVIDLLLATPEPAGPPAVQLTEVRGPVPSVRPWVRYRFADPALEDRAAGQKMLLRTGPDNARHLKAWLRALRAELVAAVPAR
jgi:hypothetical protein